MATVIRKGVPTRTSGDLPATGSHAPDFRLTTADLSDVSLASYAGKVKILNINPSLDTAVCALSAKRFDAEVAKLGGVVVLNVSRDLPFAASRFCKGEGLTTIVAVSEMRDRSFGKAYGAEVAEGPAEGLLSRAVVVIGKDDRVVYTQQVADMGHEPDYNAALEAVRKAL